MEFKRELLLNYKDLFGREESLGNLLDDVPQKVFDEVIPRLLAIDITSSPRRNIKVLLKSWFDEENIQFTESILRKVTEIEWRHKKVARIICPYTSLRLIEELVKKPPSENSKTPLSQVKINVFKAYLVINNEMSRIENEVINSTSHITPNYLKIASKFLTRTVVDFDLNNKNLEKIFFGEFVRSTLLFNLLENKEECKPLIHKLLEHFEVNNWREYLQALLKCSHLIIRKNREDSLTIHFLETQDGDIALKIFEKLALNKEVYEDSKDFISIRNTPCIKVDDRSYKILYDTFLIEKLYKGQYWLLKDINSKLPPSERINSSTLKGLFNYEFSEKTVLQKILDYFFSSGDFLTYTDQNLLNYNFEGGIDYYSRIRNHYFLFESKDIMLSADVKHSGNYWLVSKSLKDKLYFEYDGKKINDKAIKQLCKNIIYLLEKEIPIDQNYNPNRLRFYPIIVVHEWVFNVPGINVILDYWLSKEIKRNKILYKNRYRICGITLVDINTLIYYLEVFKHGKLSLDTCIEDYQKIIFDFKKNRSKQNSVLSNLLPFDYYLDSLQKRKIKYRPNFMWEIGYNLLKKE